MVVHFLLIIMKLLELMIQSARKISMMRIMEVNIHLYINIYRDFIADVTVMKNFINTLRKKFN